MFGLTGKATQITQYRGFKIIIIIMMDNQINVLFLTINFWTFTGKVAE